MPKLPYLPLYTGDWLKDPALSLCAPATRGVWIDLLAAMHELDRSGELRGTAEQLARIARCSTVEFAQAATELQTNRAADVTIRNGVYIVTNRRMVREYIRRSSKQSENGQIKDKKKTAEAEYEIEIEFEKFWKEFPSGRKKSKGTAREAFLKACTKAKPADIIAAATEYAASEVGRGKYVKMPTRWLNQECWNDDRKSWRDIDAAGAPTAKEYKTITPAQFKQLRDSGEFLTGPWQDSNNPGRYTGQLKNHTKVECFVERKVTA